MDLSTTIAIIAVAIPLIVALVGVWAWRRRKAAADCDRVRHSLEQMRETLGEGTGLAFKGHGAFTGKPREAYRQLRDDMASVADRKLRDILAELIQTYDAAEALAIEFDSSKSDRMVFEVAAIHFEQPDYPAKRTPILFNAAIERLTVLQRRASGL